MSASIVSRTIGGIVDKRVSLANNSMARTLNIGNNWNSIRIALRFSLTDPGTGVNLTGTPRLTIGMCSGTSNVPGDATVTNFAGARTSSATWTRATGVAPYYLFSAPQWKACVASGGALSDSASALSNSSQLICCPDLLQDPLFFDITKGSPNYTLKGFFRTGSTSPTTTSLATMLMLAEQASITYASFSQTTALSFAASESAGNLDTAVVHWDRSVPTIEICDFVVARLS